MTNQEEVEKYLDGPCKYLKITRRIEFLMTFLVMHITGYRCIYEYEKSYPNVRSIGFSVFGAGKARSILKSISNSMLSWKLLLLQRAIVEKSCPELTKDKKKIKVKGEKVIEETLDIDGFSVVSFSDKREGSLLGHHRRYRGKPTLQSSVAFIGKIFVDIKLFAGNVNVCVHFQKAVKRVRSLGYAFSAVRADTAYGKVENLLFLEKLSLSYVLGIRTSLISLKKAKTKFKKLAAKRSAKIVHIDKGSAILDLGLINVASARNEPVYRRVVLCRRIHRKKKKGKWKIKTYFYALVTDLEWSPRKIFTFYHQRQNIENALKEAQHHYFFAKLCSHTSIKANELWMVTKVFAMTMAKIFAYCILPTRFQTMYLRSIIRKFFANSIHYVLNFQVHLTPKCKHLWHIRRIFAKISQNDINSQAFVIAA